jgi:hypothetical protein
MTQDPPSADAFVLPVTMLTQTSETTCGPTCLHAIYRFWEEKDELGGVVDRTVKLEHGGTFAVFLGCDALRRGFHAVIYTYNLNVFDPTWFRPGVDLAERLTLQRELKSDYRLQQATTGYLEFLALGGQLHLADLSIAMVRRLLEAGTPLIAGLSSTYLYGSAREVGTHDTPDDLRGTPAGHFVVISGYDPQHRRLLVVDPYHTTPYGPGNSYWLPAERVLCSILLGIVTHDANLLVVTPARPGPVA